MPVSQRTGGRAFTLVELLVVIAIIALLISILLPSLGAACEQAKKAKCLANLRDLQAAGFAYAGEDQHENLIPVHENVMINQGTGYISGSRRAGVAKPAPATTPTASMPQGTTNLI